MKKIVALVLSLVMVLGLATTAFGAMLTGTYDLFSVDNITTTADFNGMKLEPVAAAAAKDTDKDGYIDVAGNVAYFNVYNNDDSATGWKFVQVASAAEADYVAFYAGKTTVFGYFAWVNPSYLGNGAVFTNFGEDCGQYDDDAIPGKTYYTFEDELYMGTTAGVAVDNLMVNGELVAVTNVDVAADWVAHTPSFSYDAKYKVVGVKCAECGVVATLYPNFASVAKADKAAALPLGDGQYYVWTAAVEAPAATDKVESAQTFDAGIAMYVGMSVMAAAGSAVVLKKKD